MGRRPTIEQLRVFIAAAEHQSFTLAAHATHKTQAAVSMQMRQLEDIAEAKLFVRGARQSALTSAGEALYAYAKEMISLEAEAWGAMRNRAKTRLRVGAPEIYMPLLVDALREFTAARPDVCVELFSAPTVQLAKRLKDGRIDVAIGVRGRHMDGELLCRQALRWAVHCSASEIWLRTPVPIALFEPGSTARTHVLDALQRTRVRYLCVHESNSLAGMLAGISAGIAVGAVPVQAAGGALRTLGPFDGLADIEPLDIVAAAGAGHALPERQAFLAALAAGSRHWNMSLQ